MNTFRFSYCLLALMWRLSSVCLATDARLDEMLHEAIEHKKPSDILAILEEGGNPNGITEILGYPQSYLMRAVGACCTPDKNEWLSVVRSLIKHGADVNFATKDGLNAAIVAERSGSEIVVRLLAEAGAKPVDKTSLAIRAHFVREDARLLEVYVDHYIVADPSALIKGTGAVKREELTFDQLFSIIKKWTLIADSTNKVLKNRGRDEFGNMIRLFPSNSKTEPMVVIDERTIKALKESVGGDFWKGLYVEKTRWSEFLSGEK